MSIESDYLANIYHNKEFVKLVSKTVKKLESLKVKYNFDCIAFRGSSGAAMAYPVSYLMKLPLMHIRKSKGHYYKDFEGYTASKRYLILDDFIETGSTIKKIINAVNKEYRTDSIKKPEPVCIYLYNSYCTESNETFQYRKSNIPLYRGQK